MKCPKCGQEYDGSFNFCPDCKEPNPSKKRTNKCPKCGSEYDFSFKFCPECAEVNPIIQKEVAVDPKPEVPKQNTVPAKLSRFGWKHIVIGVGLLLIIVGVTLGLIFGLGGGESVVGTYFNSDTNLTLVLGKDGIATIDSSRTGETTTGSYVVKEGYVKIWNPSKGSEETMKGMQLGIVDKNLVDDEGDIWVRDGESEETASPEVETSKKDGFAVGKYAWENDKTGDGMTFKTDGTWSEIQNGAVLLSGTYEVAGDTVNMTYDMAGTLVEFSYRIEGDELVSVEHDKKLVKE